MADISKQEAMDKCWMMQHLSYNVGNCCLQGTLSSSDTFGQKLVSCADFLPNAAVGGAKCCFHRGKRFDLTILVRSSQALQGMKALLEAVQKLRGSPECLTSVHSDYLQLCLVAKNFKVIGIIQEQRLPPDNLTLFQPAIALLDQRILKVTKDAMQVISCSHM